MTTLVRFIGGAADGAEWWRPDGPPPGALDVVMDGFTLRVSDSVTDACTRYFWDGADNDGFGPDVYVIPGFLDAADDGVVWRLRKPGETE